MTFAEAAVAVIAGAGGGTFAALVTPWAQWAVDKRRRRTERRSELLRGARELVHQGQDADRKILLNDPRYLAIRPHLSAEVEAKLRSQEITAMSDPYRTVGNYYLSLIRDEADRLEKEVWKL
jgi:hypothetical protein